MTLYDILPKNGDETTVYDKDYDIETYFYYSDNGDAWDNAMMDLAKLLEVVETSPSAVTVDLSGLIESKIEKLIDLFIDCDIDSIMDDIESILAGNVSQQWLIDFVKALS